MSYLAIQIIQIEYTDDQRGRVDAEKRQRIRALPLAAVAGDGVLHDCRVTTWSSYQPRTMASGVPIRNGEVCLEGVLRLRIDHEALVFVLDAGVRARESRPLFTLSADNWGRVIWNAKHARDDAKWLVEFVVNAGLFAGPPASQVFLGAPALERDLRHDFVRHGHR